jgi:cytochrome c oxidase assembly protein subunit 15
MESQRRLMWFRRLAFAGALLAAAVVVLGAWVRLTDAGLGCPDWPGCYGHVYPNSSKAMHEMIHRYFAGTLVIAIAMLLAWTLRFRKDRGQPSIAVALLFVIVCLQAVLGALTVTLLLKPLIVTAHLLGGLSTLALLWWLSLEPPVTVNRLPTLQRFALLGLTALILQIALGGWTSSNYAALACPDFPTCQGAWWPRMNYRDAFVLWRGLDIDYEGGVLANPARAAIHFTHRLGALVTGLILIGLGLLVAVRAQDRRLARAGSLLVIAVVIQIAIGAAMVHWGVPLSLATLHNAGDALLVICIATLLRALWPGPAAGMVPLARADSSR